MKSTIERISALVAVAIMAAGIAVADIRILSVTGIVRVTPPGSVNFSQAVRGMVLPEGSEVVTTASGRCRIEVSPGNTVSLHYNTSIKIASAQPRASAFQLLAGRLKGVFNKLSSDERFQVQFSNTGAVASVKGTTLAAEQNSDGYRLLTVFGEVEVKHDGRSVFIPQGTGWNGIKLEALSEDEISAVLHDTSGDEAAGARGELHTFVNEVKNTNADNQEVVTQIHENDFAVGRTLRDVHGNLARVEQILARPNGASVQFVNLVKRESYDYKGKFSYHGSSGPRFDYLEGFVSFNQSLPDSIADWPAFFSTHKDVKGLSATVTMANGAVSDNGRDVLTRTYDLQSNNNSNQPTSIVFNGVALTQDATPGIKADGGDELWTTNVSFWNAGAYQMRVEGYAIDENGKILTLGGIISNGSQDPIGYAKTLAGEGIISIVDASGNDVMHRGNIDLVFIPDMVFAIATKYASSLSSISTGGN